MTLADINETVSFIRSNTNHHPEIGLVLGSGLGALADTLSEPTFLTYGEIPHFAASTAPGHKGRLVIGKLGDKTLLCMQGRFHYYEGYSMKQVTYPIRVMKALGIKTLILTNASGGLDLGFAPGDFMLITDHINYMGVNPLIGPNEDEFGVRFPDMSRVYSRELGEIAKTAAKDLGITLRQGVYVGFTGPSYETPAEIKMFQILGAGAVGMSTVPEAIVASHCRMEVLGISCISNLASGILDVPLTGEEVIEVCDRAGDEFTRLITGVISRM